MCVIGNYNVNVYVIKVCICFDKGKVYLSNTNKTKKL